MRKKLRWLSMILALAVVLLWLAKGKGNTGWSKDSVTIMVKDPVTELEGPQIEKQWVPGMDFLAGGLGGAALLLGGSLFFGRRPKH